ncbi:MAG: hypothetical protein QOJ42_3142 [Acidobacteriaceae bacterium]|nr:hypothetical protein [Acidobacteriaceae bacterium]
MYDHRRLLNAWFRSFRDKLSRVGIVTRDRQEVSLRFRGIFRESLQKQIWDEGIRSGPTKNFDVAVI